MADTDTRDKWAAPQEVSAVEAAFPANVSHLMPARAEIPDRFWRGRSRWVDFQQRWFFSGMSGVKIVPREGVDVKAALRHLSAVQGSFEPEHNHKEAAVAYLASLWFVRATAGREVYEEADRG